MAITERIRNRLDALFAIVKPANSLAARVDNLSDEHRTIYDRYSELMREWIERNDLDDDGERGNAWAMILRGYGPHLPATITTALFNEAPKILATMTDDQVANTFRDYCDADAR